MNKVLFPVNKSVPANLKYYPEFLNILADRLLPQNIEITFMLFSDLLKDQIKSRISVLGTSEARVAKSVNTFETEYGISFKEQLYTDLLQTSKYVVKTRHRDWYLPEAEFCDNGQYAGVLTGIEKAFEENGYDIVITDQTTDYQQIFLRYFCEKNDIPYIRYIPNFMNRGFFASYGKTGNGKIVDLPFNTYDMNFSKQFVEQYRNGENPSIYTLRENNLTIYNPNPQRSLFEKLTNKNFEEFKYLSELKLKDLFFKKVENRVKKSYYDEYRKDDKYIYYGLHLTTESHVALHSYPFVNQINVIESISRALPFGYKLYVKPHPWWEHTLSLSAIKQIKKIPFVRIVDSRCSIKEIIAHSDGLVTLNATTGVEALIMGKPIIALSEVNGYVGYHPAATRCSNLYDLPRMIREMVDRKVEIENTVEYIAKMFSITSDIRLEADRFISSEDAEKKAVEFSRYIVTIVNNYPQFRSV